MKNTKADKNNKAQQEQLLSQVQLEQIADYFKKEQHETQKHFIPPVIDNAQEAKRMSDAAFRRSLRDILKECFRLTQRLTPDEMAFVLKVKDRFVQNSEVTKDEAARLVSIIKNKRGY